MTALLFNSGIAAVMVCGVIVFLEDCHSGAVAVVELWQQGLIAKISIFGELFKIIGNNSP